MSESVPPERYAAVFYAAAEGALAPARERYARMVPGHFYHVDETEALAEAQARVLAGAFKAIGDMFANIAQAELKEPDRGHGHTVGGVDT